MQSVASGNADPEVTSLVDPVPYFVEIDHEIISIVILSFLLINEELLSVTSKNMYMKYWLTA